MSTALASADAAARPARHGARSILLACVAGHALAATLILVHVIPQIGAISALSAAPGHMAAMQKGLTRLLYALVLLPPATPIAVTLLIWYSVRKAARTAQFRFWLVLALAPFIAEEIGRAAVVLASPDGTSFGELITQSTSFTAGPAVIFGLFGVTLGEDAGYWAGVLSFTGALGVYCWGRAILAAQEYSANPSILRRRRAATGLDVGLAIGTATAIYLAAAIANFFAIPILVPLFLNTFG